MSHPILIVGDDTRDNHLIAEALRGIGFHVEWTATAEEALHRLTLIAPRLVFISLPATMPDQALIRTLRHTTDVPLVILARNEDPQPLISALEAGADNYLIIPADPDLLTAWTSALLRRSGFPSAVREGVTVLDEARGTVLDESARAVRTADQLIALTATEFRLLRELAYFPNQAVSRGTLHRHIWTDEGITVTGRPLDTQMSRLRAKLEVDPREPRMLITVRGEGYRLDPQ